MVDDTDDLESVADRIKTVIETGTGDGVAETGSGVVLRSRGETANRVQRLADQLCNQDIVTDTALPRPLDKEDTDVVGQHKDELEFRLYLADTQADP